MQKNKIEKGITLIVAVITITVMLLLITPIAINLTDLSNINDFSKLKSDFKVLNEAISVVSNDNTLVIGPVFSGNINLGTQRNSRDGNIYYVIDYNLLQQMYRDVAGVRMDGLYYGSNNMNIDSNLATYENEDIYIMNKDTHTVYYLSKINGAGYYIGFEYKDEIYYTI